MKVTSGHQPPCNRRTCECEQTVILREREEKKRQTGRQVVPAYPSPSETTRADRISALPQEEGGRTGGKLNCVSVTFCQRRAATFLFYLSRVIARRSQALLGVLAPVLEAVGEEKKTWLNYMQMWLQLCLQSSPNLMSTL